MSAHQAFYSNGKLLITAEYLVLDGAKALALPTKYGQDLSIEENSGNQISWTSYDHDGTIWYQHAISCDDILSGTEQPDNVSTDLVKILHEASNLRPGFLTGGFKIETHLTFPKSWGLGTSSTLINNIADWFGIDAFELLKRTFGGSGYDIACARNDSAILYHLQNKMPVVEKLFFSPPFAEQLYFIYLNKKQDSRAAIANYKKISFDIERSVKEVNQITDQIIAAKTVQEFSSAIENHEDLLADILQISTVKLQLFSDFPGAIKSLGAWGGDFIMAVCEDDPTSYFKQKGFSTVIRFRDMIK